MAEASLLLGVMSYVQKCLTELSLIGCVSLNAESDEPWYVMSKRKGAEEESAKSKHKKELMDPLKDIKYFVGAKKKCLEAAEPRSFTFEVSLRMHTFEYCRYMYCSPRKEQDCSTPVIFQ